MTSPWRLTMRADTPRVRRDWYAAMRACPTCSAAKARRDYCDVHEAALTAIEVAEAAAKEARTT